MALESAQTVSPPEQAVILAGGLGTRLRPLTLTRPKPMIEFHGHPFLEYLIRMLAEQGVTRVVLLLGYLPNVIRDHFGNGDAFGVRIDYVVGDVAFDTGRRLKQAEPLLDPAFLLLYCDNYWPMPYRPMWRRFLESDRLAQVTVYRNRDGYTRDNLAVDADGAVTVYDKTRTADGLCGVDIGFILMRREVLELLPADGNPSFEATVYPKLVAERQLGAFETDHRYYSVGDHKRLPVTEAFLAQRPAIFLDRDGTLNRRMPLGAYVRSWAEWEWLPGARQAIRALCDAGYRIILVTNQAGIARNELTHDALDDIHARLRADVQAVGGCITDILVCPHGWNEGCSCRKPAPGMLLEAQRRHHLDLSRTPLIGDDDRDGAAAAAAGCPHRILGDGESLLDAVTELLSAEGTSHSSWIKH